MFRQADRPQPHDSKLQTDESGRTVAARLSEVYDLNSKEDQEAKARSATALTGMGKRPSAAV